MAGWPNQVKTVVTEDDYHLSTMHYYAKGHSTVDLLEYQMVSSTRDNQQRNCVEKFT